MTVWVTDRHSGGDGVRGNPGACQERAFVATPSPFFSFFFGLINSSSDWHLLSCLQFVNPPQDGRDQEICTSIPIYGQSAGALPPLAM